jgi:hypothetical protein
MYIAISDVRCSTIDKMGESWGVEIDLIEESYNKFIEFGGVNEGHQAP